MPQIPVKVEHLFLSNVGFVVLLKSQTDPRSLPIFIGAAEAQSIAIFINEVTVPRPLTHDLLKNTLDLLECRVMRVEINNLAEGTFYAKLMLEKDGGMVEIDARPSDAIALALRCAAPILVEESVMNEAGREFDEEELRKIREQQEQQMAEAQKKKTPQPAPKKPTPLESLNFELSAAVRDERYEDAARIRDEISKLEGPHTGN